MNQANGKPLSVSLGESLAAKSSEPTLVSRPSPPTARPSRIAVYRNDPPQQLHALPPPAGPDRSLVASAESGERTRKRRTHLSEEAKAAAVKRVLDGETGVAVAADLGVSDGAVHGWVREAKAAAARRTAKAFEANDITQVSQELAEALKLQRAAEERVKVLKARLRVLLGDE